MDSKIKLFEKYSSQLTFVVSLKCEVPKAKEMQNFFFYISWVGLIEIGSNMICLVYKCELSKVVV